MAGRKIKLLAAVLIFVLITGLLLPACGAEKGSVIERGTHAQLMALRGQYFKTYTAQYNTEEDLVPAAGKEEMSHVC